jgi:hypothetical protein
MPALHEVIREFAARRAIQPPAIDAATGGCALAIDGRYMVHLLETGSSVVAWAWLGDLPGEEGAQESLLRRLLRAELGRLGEDDAILSVDPADGALNLHRLVASASLDPDSFERLLQSLVDSVERRRGSLGERPSPRPSAPLVIRP